MASPESGLWWVLWIRNHPWLVLAPKVLQPCANQLVCWFCAGLLKWVNCLSLFLVPSQNSSTPIYPSKVLKARSVPRAPNLSVVYKLGLSLSLPKRLGVRQKSLKQQGDLYTTIVMVTIYGLSHNKVIHIIFSLRWHCPSHYALCHSWSHIIKPCVSLNHKA